MRQGTIIITPSAVAALTLGEIKQQVGIDPGETGDADEDTRLTGLGVQAQDFVQRALGIPLFSETRETHLYGFPGFPSAIWLASVGGLTVTSVKYIDTAGVEQTLAPTAYALDAVSQPARIVPAPGTCWPLTQVTPGAVKVRWSAGYANAAALPPVLKRAMLLLVGHWDANREAVVTGTISSEVQLTLDAVLDQFRSRWMGTA